MNGNETPARPEFLIHDGRGLPTPPANRPVFHIVFGPDSEDPANSQEGETRNEE